MWAYLRAHDVPVNPLHARGYPSIGCEPCTSPVRPGEDPRAGRWRGAAKTECGLHSRTRRPAPSPCASPDPKEPEPCPCPAPRAPSSAPTGASSSTASSERTEADALRRRAARLPAAHARRARARRPRADRDGRREPAHRLPRARPTTRASSSGCGSRTARCGRCPSRWPCDEARALVAGRRRGAPRRQRPALGRDRGERRLRRAIRSRSRARSTAPRTRRTPASPTCSRVRARSSAGRCGCCRCPRTCPSRATASPRAQLRARIADRGWRRVAGFQTRNPIHRAHEHLTKLALEYDGRPRAPSARRRDEERRRARRRALPGLRGARRRATTRATARSSPRSRRPCATPARARRSSTRSSRKNYGITHLIVGRDHAGVGKFYGPYEAQQIFDRFAPEELGVTPLRFEPTFFCHACDALASPRTCPHDARVAARAVGHEGARDPARRRPPARASSRARRSPRSCASTTRPARRAAAPAPLRARGGFIVWFTGLSGAGKSTLARGAAPRARGRAARSRSSTATRCGRTCRRASASRSEDRDTNIRRIGYVARLARPQRCRGRSPRRSRPTPRRAAEVRRLAEEDGVPFVEVFAEATIESLAARDVKGLYEKALAGEIAHFTGVSDPYEPPVAPDVVVRTDRETVGESLGPHPRGARGARAARAARRSRPGVVSAPLPGLPEARGPQGPGRGRRAGGALEARVAPRHRRAGDGRGSRGPPGDRGERRRRRTPRAS